MDRKTGDKAERLLNPCGKEKAGKRRAPRHIRAILVAEKDKATLQLLRVLDTDTARRAEPVAARDPCG
jgi:hypothetical protein